MKVISNSINYEKIDNLPGTKFKGKVGSFYDFEMTVYSDGVPIFEETGLPEELKNKILKKISLKEGIIFRN
jgi:hypothetical protein